MTEFQSGNLYVVSTPIGNLEDITYRAIKILSSVDLILCEDTRRTKILCSHYNIKTPLKSYYSYIERKRIREIIPYIKTGHNVALVSDSGTPSISDPGYVIINECINENIKVVPVPGATAFVAGVVCSGLPLEKIVFLGFLPKKVGKIKRLFYDLGSIKNLTVVFYQSPRRVKQTLELLMSIFGQNVKCVIAKELTKIHEQFIRGNIKEVYDKIYQTDIKGEYVIMFFKD
ncbi:MAG: 16S rRNA (cytidine(1402)-2'-O)-methyltransferase [Endomicrobia bacterium]|nr:16S rRNA (cytidine(1402)-2'-O)-methyltransferase [Endomicrobiia bacterium]MCX7940544.1 16S rRNA (cytidine(1402)-2'-O)-methyltransferase [Endomicrobiia bacterium]MDW8056029.1 16S rRNA (cytidine(1402)-2'-O)-methyltransferase [Elusimicrobiota bacterium]